jgi:hypothetical protein
VKNRLQQRAIIKLAQTAALRVDQADRHHLGQIVVADLPHPLLAQDRLAEILAADQEKIRSERQNEKINYEDEYRIITNNRVSKWAECL